MWFKPTTDSKLQRSRSLDSSESTSYNLLQLALLTLTTCEIEEIGTLVSNSSANISSLLESKSDQLVLSALHLTTSEIDRQDFDDMAAPASLYNNELGTPQTLFFDHARAMFENKCLDPERMLRGYVEMDFLRKYLYPMLGQETNKFLVQFCIDRTHIPAVGIQTILHNNSSEQPTALESLRHGTTKVLDH